MKLHLSATLNHEELDAAAGSPLIKNALIRKIASQFADAAQHAIETRLTEAHDRGVPPSNMVGGSGFHFQAEGGIQT